MTEYLYLQPIIIDLAEKAGYLLREKGCSISTAESCTGGLLAAALTSISGSSDYFSGGIVSYSNQLKVDILNVSPLTLEKWGAVSSATAREMAENVRNTCRTDFGISLTGIAGPGGGSRSKPVGLVYIGIAADKTSRVIKELFKGNRHEIRLSAVKSALEHIIDFMQRR